MDQNFIFCSNASRIRCAKTNVVTVCVEVSSVASNINDIFLTGKISLEGQMVQPWRTWTVKFQVETVPRVATLHLACYGAACVVSRPQPLLMASTRLSLAQTNMQQRLFPQCNKSDLLQVRCWIEVVSDYCNFFHYYKWFPVFDLSLNNVFGPWCETKIL